MMVHDDDTDDDNDVCIPFLNVVGFWLVKCVFLVFWSHFTTHAHKN